MLTKIEGAFGIVALHKDHKQILCARKGSPLVLGVNNGEFFIASDPSPFLEYTKEVIYLNEKQMASIEETGYKIKDFNGFNIEMEIETIPFGIESIQKQGFEHFMLKEIYEQAETIQNCFRGKIRHIENISIAKECGQGIYVHAGPEIGVASTKAFTSQIIAMNLLNVYLNKDPYYRAELIEELEQLPEKVKAFFKTQDVKAIAEKYKDSKYFMFMGRDINYPVAMEGALKLKKFPTFQ